MPRLTRTQKYADLREQLANGKEELFNTQELKNYQDRLNNVQEILSPTTDNKTEDLTEYLWTPFKEDTSIEDKLKDLKPIVETAVEEVIEIPVVEETPTIEEFVETPAVEEVIETPEVEQPVIEETPAVEDVVVSEPVEEPVVQEQPTVEEVIEAVTIDDVATTEQIDEVPVQEQPVEVEEVIETPVVEEFAEVPVTEEVPIQKETQNSGSYFDSFMNEVDDSVDNATDDFNKLFESSEEKKPDLTIEEIYNDVFDDVNDASGEIVSIKERDTYLNQTISDVNLYNENSGQATIEEIINSSVDEVRHQSEDKDVLAKEENAELVANEQVEVNEEEPVIDESLWNSITEQAELDADAENAEPVVDDEEFSNTVSMEISKIMDEIVNAPEPVQPEVTIPAVEEALETKTIVEEVDVTENTADVVEIKNIAEVENEPVRDTISSTIPFVVAADDEEIIDEEEEDGSNTVLNVILIVLIVVLIAVLGLIVFYILKTKGIF